MSIPESTPTTDDFHADLPAMRAASHQMADLAALANQKQEEIAGPVESVVQSNLGLPSAGILSNVLTVALRHAVGEFAADLDAQSGATARAERLFWIADDELRVKASGIGDGDGLRPGSTVT